MQITYAAPSCVRCTLHCTYDHTHIRTSPFVCVRPLVAPHRSPVAATDRRVVHIHACSSWPGKRETREANKYAAMGDGTERDGVKGKGSRATETDDGDANVGSAGGGNWGKAGARGRGSARLGCNNKAAGDDGDVSSAPGGVHVTRHSMALGVKPGRGRRGKGKGIQSREGRRRVPRLALCTPVVQCSSIAEQAAAAAARVCT